MHQRLIAGLAGVLFLFGVALAGGDKPLTEDQAKRFVATLSAIDALGDQLEAAGKTENLKVATEDVGGENRFWFGVLSELTAEAILTDPLWTVAGRDNPSILIN